MQGKLKIGIMGGTFNPIHYGHLVTAEEAANQFALDQVIFMPTGNPTYKENRDIVEAEHRYLMVVIATASNPKFVVSRMEVDRGGETRSIDTISELYDKYRDSAQLFFITGADAILEILTWKEPHIVIQKCKFIAATRPGYDILKIRSLDESLLGRSLQNSDDKVIYVMEVPALAISSTDIRRRVKEGRPIKYLLPEGVANYIQKMGFYLPGKYKKGSG